MNTIPILFSVPSDNGGEYRLFGEVTPHSIVTDQAIHRISDEELVIIKRKHLFMRLSKSIETFLEKNREDSYHITKYTIFQIDEVQAEIYVYCDIHDMPYSYYYKIIAKHIEYETNESINKDFLLYESKCFTTVYSLLEHVKKVEETYEFLDYYLLSPEKMEEAKAQRLFFPLLPDKVCSVCYEPTIEYTTCKHPICLKCREKCIVKENNRCPICRGSELSIYPNSL